MTTLGCLSDFCVGDSFTHTDLIKIGFLVEDKSEHNNCYNPRTAYYKTITDDRPKMTIELYIYKNTIDSVRRTVVFPINNQLTGRIRDNIFDDMSVCQSDATCKIIRQSFNQKSSTKPDENYAMFEVTAIRKLTPYRLFSLFDYGEERTYKNKVIFVNFNLEKPPTALGVIQLIENISPAQRPDYIEYKNCVTPRELPR